MKFIDMPFGVTVNAVVCNDLYVNFGLFLVFSHNLLVNQNPLLQVLRLMLSNNVR